MRDPTARRQRDLAVRWNLIALVALLLGGVVAAEVAQSRSRLPAHGPKQGYLLLNGGINFTEDIPRFITMAGGPDARIVMIPTAARIPADATREQLQAEFCAAFAAVHCTVLHTTDRSVANSPTFVAPIRQATGVWLEPPRGGRQWRLADAYLDTLTLRELFNLLDRGGVIGGGSAGATIQGSYLVRGSSTPNDSSIMMAPGHETAFGFLTNTAIDQHVDTRGREDDLGEVMRAHPELLGLGLDEDTSITVHGDEFVVNGPGRVAVWDGEYHDGKPYYYLFPGDKLNTATAVATRVNR